MMNDGFTFLTSFILSKSIFRIKQKAQKIILRFFYYIKS